MDATLARRTPEEDKAGTPVRPRHFRLLVGATVALDLLVVAAVGLFLYANLRTVDHQADTVTYNLAGLLARDVEARLDRVDAMLGALVVELDREIATGGVDRARLRELVERDRQVVPGVARLAVFDANGRQVCAAQPPACAKVDIAGEDFYRQLRERPDLTVPIARSAVVAGDLGHAVVVPRALRAPDGVFAGVVVAVVPPEAFAQVFESLDLGPGGAASLRDAELSLLARYPLPSAAQQEERRQVARELERAMQANPDGGRVRAVSAMDGIEREIAYRRVARYPLYVMVGLGSGDLLREWRRDAGLAIFLASLFVLFTFVLLRLVITGSRVQHAGMQALRARERELRDSEGRYRTLVATMDEGVLLLDAQGATITHNAGASRILGRTPDEMAGSAPLDALVGPPIAMRGGAHADVVASPRDTLRTGRPLTNRTLAVYRPDGSTVWLSVNAQPIFAAASRTPTGVVVTFRDITEEWRARTEAERVLAEQRTTLGSDLMAVVRARDRHVTWCNPAYAALLGAAGEDLAGQPTRQFFPDDASFEAFGEALRSALAAGGIHRSEIELVRRDGTRIVVDAAFSRWGTSTSEVQGIFVDITERRRTGDVQRERERLLAQTEAIARIGSWRLDLGTGGEGDRWTASEGLRRLFGFPMDAPVTWESVLAYLDAEAREQVCAQFRGGKARGGHAQWEHAVEFNGRPGWILCHAEFLLDEHGVAREVRGTVQDITDRKEMEERLRTSERRLSLAADAGAVGLWDLDLVSGDAWRSPRHAEIFGEASTDTPWSTEKLLAHVVPEDRERIERCIRDSMPGSAVEWETRILRADGVLRTIAVRGEVVADGQGRAIRALGTVADVTERRQAEDILLQQQAVLQTMHEGVVVVQAASGTILLANRKLESMFGYGPGELEGRHVRSLHAAGDGTPAVTAETIMAAIARDGSWSGDIRNVRKDGSRFWCHATVSTLEQQRHGTVIVSVQQDITDRKRAQDDLTALNDSLESLVAERTAELRTARDEAEAANRAKGEFLANMSHELRTPLHGVLGMTGLAQRLATDAKQKRYLETVATAAAQLGGIIDGILDVVKTDTERVHLAKTPFRLAGVVDLIADECGPKAREKGLDFAVEVPPALRVLQCVGDPLRLGQVLRNLTDNAIKFTETGRVALGGRVVEENAMDALVRFEITDSGIGVDPDLRPRMFEPFEQADTSRTRKHGGAGVGLAICKRLAEAMGGTIGVDSAGAGSCFWFTARLAKDAHDAASASAAETAEQALQRAHRHKKVLLVEDDVDNRDLALAQLKSVWPEIDCAADGVEAIERVRERRYDVILMDMRMPRMDGIEATQRIRALPNGAAVPIIAMTANVYHEDRTRCLEVGMNDFIPKAVGGGPPFATLLKWLSVPDAG